MGLDMYLERRNSRTKSYENVGYWRKANQIHNWFVENVQEGIDDCNCYEVSEEQLKNLLDVCRKVKDDINHAKELLPTCEGFFFGSTEYDDYYLENIDSSIKLLERVLKETNFNEESIFYYSWW